MKKPDYCRSSQTGDTQSDRPASGLGAKGKRRIHDAAAVLARLLPVERRYAQSTSGRMSSQRIAPLDSRSMLIAKDSPTDCPTDRAFRRYPIEVPHREANAACSTGDKPLRYSRSVSMSKDYPSVTFKSIPCGHLLDGNEGKKCVMDSDRKKTRRARLMQLMHERFGGRQVALANHVGIVANIVSRYLSGRKGIGEDMRDKIEDACGLPRGWLDAEYEITPDRDADHENAGPVLLSSNVAAQESQAEYELSTDSILFSDAIRERFMQLTPEGKGHARAMLLTGIKEAEELYSELRANAG